MAQEQYQKQLIINDKVSEALGNFLLPDSKETLRIISSMARTDLEYCLDELCRYDGGVDRAYSFGGVDLDSLKFILEHNILPINELCIILSKTFEFAGVVVHPHRKIYEYKLRGLDYKKLAELKEKITKDNNTWGYVELATDNITYLLDYLCDNYAEFVLKNYGNKFFDEIFTSGVENTNVKQRYSWIRKLLSIGCSPFVTTNSDHCTPFIHVLIELYYDLAVEMLQLPNAPDAAVLAVSINQYKQWERHNLLQDILIRYANCKKPETLVNLKNVINLVVKLGIDVNYVHADDGITVTDCVHEYGYTSFLADELPKYNLPKCTENKFRGWVKFLHVDKSCAYSGLFHKYRCAKSEQEFDSLRAEYDAIEASHGPITESMWRDDLQYTIIGWEFAEVIPKIAKLPFYTPMIVL